MLEPHLPFADGGGIKFEAEGEFRARQINREGEGLADFAAGDVLQKELQFRGIGGHQAESTPARDGQVLGNLRQQLLVEQLEDLMGKAVPRFREGLGAELAPEVGAVIEVGSEDVEFVLDAGGHSRQQRGENTGERQLAVAEKGGGFEPNSVEQFGRVEVVREGAQNAQEFKIPLSITLIES